MITVFSRAKVQNTLHIPRNSSEKVTKFNGKGVKVGIGR